MTVIYNVWLRIDAGRLFETRGPSTAKEWSPNVVLVDGTSSIDDLRQQADGDWRVQILCEMNMSLFYVASVQYSLILTFKLTATILYREETDVGFNELYFYF